MPPTKEDRIKQAIEAVKNEENLSLRAAAKRYDVPESTLRGRLTGGRRARHGDIVAVAAKPLRQATQGLINVDLKKKAKLVLTKKMFDDREEELEAINWGFDEQALEERHEAYIRSHKS
ncbi:hypothetical protein BZA70DRAFT_290650 [Myxozyma melibiosi]|uniref:HTH psq-type domain-containing protein n=1 Tax=Myxozyma melibiosi TaxID=54550 RepID=A0ABR1F2M2_9ASCO